MSYSGFSRQSISVLRYFQFAPDHAPRLPYGFSFTTRSSLLPVLSSPAHTFGLCPHSSVIRQYRNFNLLSIGYVSPPLLRSRLTRGRSALPRNPWIFGQEDSHLFLATHSGILPSRRSTVPLGTASVHRQCSPTNHLRDSRASVVCFSPGHFRRGTSRLVSCYALFECVAASEPTS